MRGALEAPFPWFGGKRRIAPIVWGYFGRVSNYVEPFYGSGAVLLNRPHIEGVETINDADGYVANFWRAIKQAPELTAEYADDPVNENDLHARHAWLLQFRDELPARLEADPEWCDPKVAGWWVWGICCWIGHGFCSGAGPWRVQDGKLMHLGGGQGVNRQRVHLGGAGQGVNRRRVHLGGGQSFGMGIHSANRRDVICEWFTALSQRLRRVRVCCGDWSRVCGPTVTFHHGLTAVLLDPPYGEAAQRHTRLYRVDDSAQLSARVREWAIEMGQRPDMRIALCGYEGEHEMPAHWDCVAWDAGAGYGGQAVDRTGNGARERIWFSPGCIPARQPQFAFLGGG